MADQKTENSTFLRLPTNIVPVVYDVTIIPEISNFTFAGSETVHVNVTEETNTVKLNVFNIEIQKASFVINGQEHQTSDININNTEEVATLTFANNLPVGSGQLKLEFTGLIADDLKGVYRNKYVTQNGETRYGISTQFESVYCRRAFPCWDEPALKAKFNLTLVAPKDRVALSNMEVIEEKDYELDNSKRVLKFGTSPIMSTYLLAYVIGEYEFIEQTTKNNTKIRVYTALGKTDQGKFALDVAVRCLEFYEDYFKIKFPLPKCDLIAIAEFQSGAMENWGLITYRETCILYDPQNSSTIRKQWIALVVCHELAHQWFGNLVTMAWWNDLWLNEGFASFIEYLAVDTLLPEFNIFQTFVTDTTASALELDGLHNSHPIEVPVNHPNEIEEIFDTISYSKGSAIIRMLYEYIGNDAFQLGMNSYLNKYSYANAVTDQLWESLEEASQKPVSSVMSTWTRQKGYPVVSVVSSQDGPNRVLTLTQEKFSNDGKLSEQDKQTKWLVPLSIITQNNPKPVQVLLENTSQKVILENVEPNEWIKLNTGLTSFCRVNYSQEMLDQFKSSIIDKSLNSIDRLNLQNDLSAFAISGKISSDRVLKFMECYIDEIEYPVWDIIISTLRNYNDVLAYTDYQEVFHLYCRKLLANIFSRVGMKPVPNEDHVVSILRTHVVSLLSLCKDPQVLQEARTQFESHVSKIALISPDLRGPLYRAVIRECDDKTWEQFFQLYRETDFQEEKLQIARSLASTQDVQRIHKVIEFALSDQVGNQDAAYVFISISQSKVGREIAWNYFKKNHQDFIKRYSSGSILVALVKYLTQSFATEEQYADVAAFFTSNPIPSTERTVQQSLESIRSNIDLLSRDAVIIKNYLTNSSQL